MLIFLVKLLTLLAEVHQDHLKTGKMSLWMAPTTTPSDRPATWVSP